MIPSDAILVLGIVVLANGIHYSPLLNSVPARALVGLPFLFVLPGYALVAALFPGKRIPGSTSVARRTSADGRLSTASGDADLGKRLALSVGASVVLLPLIAMALSLLDLAYTPWIVITTLSAFVVAGMVVAVLRRYRLPADERFRVPYRRWLSTAGGAVGSSHSTVDTVLNVALAVVVLASVAGVGYAVVAPTGEESFTSVSLLTEGPEGDLVAANYSADSFDPSGEELVLEVANEEGAETTYTVVGELQHVETSETSVTVESRTEHVRQTETVAAGSAWRLDHAVDPETSGEDLRLVYYVYRGEAPAEPSQESAYRTVFVWVDVPTES